MKKYPIVLPIIFNTEETSKLTALEIDVNEDDYQVLNMYFYQISAISPYIKNNKQCIILSNGDEFICTLDIKSVLTKIQESL